VVKAFKNSRFAVQIELGMGVAIFTGEGSFLNPALGSGKPFLPSLFSLPSDRAFLCLFLDIGDPLP